MENDWDWAMQAQEQEQWLRDEDAQKEWNSWLDLINELNTKD